MVEVRSVCPDSPAQRHGLLSGDIIISINSHPVNDVLDYRFYLTERIVTLRVHRGAELFDVTIKKGEYDDIGLEFETYLMDKKHCCKNKCIFCFIDQMPHGCRDTLYFKDDDSRLSYLMGNYVTLTNLTDEDIDRIIKMRLSPLNISVHTTNPSLRVFMMKNPRAAEIMDVMCRLRDGGINMNGQIVLCRGINDGDELERSMRDLYSLYPYMTSVSIVPCGLTDYRQGLYHIEPFDKATSGEVVAQVEAFAEKCFAECGERIFYCGDEFYINAGLKFHDGEYYGDFCQLENGVGTITDFNESFFSELEYRHGDNTLRSLSAATGAAAYPYIKAALDELEKKFPHTHVELYRIENNFFGKNITVAGLITATDLEKALCGMPLGERLILPSVMLRADGDLFLDGVSLSELSERLGLPIDITDSTGAGLINTIIGEE